MTTKGEDAIVFPILRSRNRDLSSRVYRSSVYPFPGGFSALGFFPSFSIKHAQGVLFMSIDQMTILEKRVGQILELMKRLKKDNAFLEEKVKTIGQRLAQRERDRLRWNHDRVRLRSKVERILSEMEALPRDARSGKRGGA